jgi:hypothetical protein
VRLFRGDELRVPVRDDDGRFRFDDVAPGRVSLFVQAKDLLPTASRLVARAGARHEAEIEVEAGGHLEGTVVDGEGRPLAGARVHAAPAKGERTPSIDYLVQSRDTTSDEEGRFRVSGLPAGDAWLIASHRGSEGARRLACRSPMRLETPASDLRIVLRPLGGVRLRLVRPDGSPFLDDVGFWVRRAEGGSSGGTTRPEADGTLTRDDLGDGPFEVSLDPGGFSWETREFRVVDGAVADLGEVRLDPGVSLEGRVVDLAGRPLPGATVETGESRCGARRAVTGADGRFVLEHCRREPVGFSVVADVGETRVEADPSTGRPVEVRLGPPTPVTLTVRWPEGATQEAAFELRRPDAAVRRGREWVEEREVEFVRHAGSEHFFVGARSDAVQELPSGRWLVIWEDDDGVEHRLAEWDLDGRPCEKALTLPGAAAAR